MVGLLERRLRGRQVGLGLERVGVLALLVEDLPRRPDPPRVERGVVAEAGEELVRLGVALRRGVEVEPGVVDVVLGDGRGGRAAPLVSRRTPRSRSRGCRSPCGTRRPPAPRSRTARSRSGGSAPLPRARLRGRSARRSLGAPRPAATQAPSLPLASRLVDLLGQRDASRQVDPHAEEARRRRRDDLRQARGRVRRAVRHHLRAPGAFEEDDRLQRVRVDPAGLGRRLDLVAPLRRSARRGDHAAGALLVDHVGGPERRPLGELLRRLGRPGERVARGQRRLRARLARDLLDLEVDGSEPPRPSASTSAAIAAASVTTKAER